MKLAAATAISVKSSRNRWLVATVAIGRSEAREILGEPQLIETDRFETTRGIEEHWAFQFECGIEIGIVLRVPQGKADIFSNTNDSSAVLENIGPLVDRIDVKQFDPPIIQNT